MGNPRSFDLFHCLLDLGIDGIVVPQVNTADEARSIIVNCKYPPQGNRSVGISRAHGYGMKFREYVSQANESLAIILQIEHAKAVENIEKILAVEGIDALVIGPYDLSGSLGRPGEIDHPDVQSAMERVQEACMKYDVCLGIFAGDIESARRYVERGFSILAVGMDSFYLWRSARETLEALRNA